MVGQGADGVRFEWQARLDHTINQPQSFNIFDQKLAGSASKHTCEKNIPPSIFGHRHRDIAGLCHERTGRVHKIALMLCRVAAPRWAHPTERRE
jgi:hypothetical protein